ncbi:chemotaxis protein CheB [Candidatus Sulfidibacterium hydrothermale]|jgi:two-component system chemotaxis response regulator CheB|uniref:chemotaxis protein CheB n=1 Tax=Candidatus Sulfidibacterium hydrothermale TaxID=2875962 RepID=UPI001F0AEDBE|nr:chemotaxis protein CheB [Candidatus Sulfidibacterium hydrothermale]UBM61630.1 chemotaxis protein CheB [Candidatus Sulfidibacterium hydrothermale]
MNEPHDIQAVVMGASAGGLYALKKLLPALPASFPCPLLVVQHMSPHSDNYMVKMLDQLSNIRVKEADEKEPVLPGTAYFAPPDYHLLVESDFTLSLSVEEKVNYSRPAIDVLFETAADAYGPHLMGIVLTGANADGAAGLSYIKKKGGYTVVQHPDDAESPAMPRAALEKANPHRVLSLDEILSFLCQTPFCSEKK